MSCPFSLYSNAVEMVSPSLVSFMVRVLMGFPSNDGGRGVSVVPSWVMRRFASSLAQRISIVAVRLVSAVLAVTARLTVCVPATPSRISGVSQSVASVCRLHASGAVNVKDASVCEALIVSLLPPLITMSLSEVSSHPTVNSSMGRRK